MPPPWGIYPALPLDLPQVATSTTWAVPGRSRGHPIVFISGVPLLSTVIWWIFQKKSECQSWLPVPTPPPQAPAGHIQLVF